jgi:hypothetical protein
MAKKRRKRRWAKKPDMVNSPSHYNQGEIECIDAVEAFTDGYKGSVAASLAQCVIYIWRAPHKGEQLQDLKKAEWFLKRAIQRVGQLQEKAA